MSAVVIQFRPKRTPDQPTRRKLTKAQIAERIYHLSWVARDLEMEITEVAGFVETPFRFL